MQINLIKLKNNKKRILSKSSILKELAPYLNLGIQLTITVCLGALFGWWLDSKFNAKPLFLIIFSFLGVIIGFYNFFKTISQLEKKKKEKK